MKPDKSDLINVNNSRNIVIHGEEGLTVLLAIVRAGWKTGFPVTFSFKHRKGMVEVDDFTVVFQPDSSAPTSTPPVYRGV